MSYMKATIEFEDALYRRLKSEAALRGRSVKDLVAEGVREVLAQPQLGTTHAPLAVARPDWLGALNKYARNAAGRHDLAAIRGSIVRARLKRAP